MKKGKLKKRAVRENPYTVFAIQTTLVLIMTFAVVGPYWGALRVTSSNDVFADNEMSLASAHEGARGHNKRNADPTPSATTNTTTVTTPVTTTAPSPTETTTVAPTPTPAPTSTQPITTITTPTPAPIAVSAPVTLTTSRTEDFSQSYVVQEAGTMSGSNDPQWWLSSGGYFYSTSGIGHPVIGSLSAIDKWRIAFSISNPVDTDGGYHPQNIFRLVTKSKWSNFTQEAYFNIGAINMSESPNRNASNGIFFFNRYKDQNNIYYTGLRVDGYAVIKKKINGAYYTMAYNRIVPGTYNRLTAPNLLPLNKWIGMRSVVKTNADGSVTVQVYADIGKTGNWQLVAAGTDNGSTYGPIIAGEGYAGIRTDFMDVNFDDYKLNTL